MSPLAIDTQYKRFPWGGVVVLVAGLTAGTLLWFQRDRPHFEAQDEAEIVAGALERKRAFDGPVTLTETNRVGLWPRRAPLLLAHDVARLVYARGDTALATDWIDPDTGDADFDQPRFALDLWSDPDTERYDGLDPLAFTNQAAAAATYASVTGADAYTIPGTNAPFNSTNVLWCVARSLAALRFSWLPAHDDVVFSTSTNHIEYRYNWSGAAASLAQAVSNAFATVPDDTNQTVRALAGARGECYDGDDGTYEVGLYLNSERARLIMPAPFYFEADKTNVPATVAFYAVPRGPRAADYDRVAYWHPAGWLDGIARVWSRHSWNGSGTQLDGDWRDWRDTAPTAADVIACLGTIPATTYVSFAVGSTIHDQDDGGVKYHYAVADFQLSTLTNAFLLPTP